MFCYIQLTSAHGLLFPLIILLLRKVFILGGCCFMKKPYQPETTYPVKAAISKSLLSQMEKHSAPARMVH